MADLKPGDWIAGEYRVRRVFGGHGKSGMGVVYLVEGRSAEEPFVLKTFQRSAQDSSLISRFKREAEIWVKLGKHPNLVFCHWLQEFDGQLFVALEYIWPDLQKRNTLSQYLREGPVRFEKAHEWIAHFCLGMQHALAHGVTAHRDIKPDNLMVDNEGRLKLTDFGLTKATALHDTMSSDVNPPLHLAKDTIAGVVLGTPQFMAPEQFFDSTAVDHRADIYSLGIVIYMMITGGALPINPQVTSTDESAVLYAWAVAHLHHSIRKLDSPLMALALKCLEKQPDHRFQSYDEIVNALSELGQKFRLKNYRYDMKEDEAFASEYAIAQSFVNLGNHATAETYLRQMALRWPQRSGIYTELGRVMIGLNRWNEALEETKKSLSIYPSSTSAWNNLGNILGSLSRIDEAREAFAHALTLDPENTGAIIALAQLEYLRGNTPDALKLSELALFWRPSKLLVLRISSHIILSSGKIIRAKEVIEQLLKIDPSDVKAWFNLSLCYQMHKEPHRQIWALKEVLARNPTDAEALNFLIQPLVDIGETEQAIDACKRLQQIPKWEVVGACRQAQLLVLSGSAIIAFALLRHWLTKHKRSAQLWYTYAMVLSKMDGQKEEAIIAANSAVICYEENPHQMAVEDYGELQRLVLELSRN